MRSCTDEAVTDEQDRTDERKRVAPTSQDRSRELTRVRIAPTSDSGIAPTGVQRGRTDKQSEIAPTRSEIAPTRISDLAFPAAPVEAMPPAQIAHHAGIDAAPARDLRGLIERGLDGASVCRGACPASSGS